MEFAKKKLHNILGNDLVSLLHQCKAMVAGGAITSIFCNRDIVDIDVYVRNKESLVTLITELYRGGYYVICHTKKATLFVKGDLQVQVIHIDYFDSPEKVFELFDFTVCMGAYDFAMDDLVLHPQFLLHNSQRVLEFNVGTRFPLMSVLRVAKYKDKGYNISKSEYLRIILACMDLSVTSYAELKKQLGGLYGLNMDKVFDETKEFSLKDAMEQLGNLYESDDYYKEPTKLDFDSADDLLDNIIGDTKRYFESNGKKYLVRSSGTAKQVREIPENTTKITANEYFAEHKLTKYVKEVNGRYFSFYDDKFEYALGEVAVGRGRHGTGIFCAINEGGLMYDNYDNAVLIELEIVDEDDVISIDDKVELRKAKFKAVI